MENPLRWRHNDNDGVSNHQPRGCLLNCLFRRISKKTSKLRVTGLCAGNSPGPVNSPHKGPVTRKMLPFDDVIMLSGVIMFCCSWWRSNSWPSAATIMTQYFDLLYPTKIAQKVCFLHCEPRVVMLNVTSLLEPQVVVMTIYGAAIDEKFSMKTLLLEMASRNGTTILTFRNGTQILTVVSVRYAYQDGLIMRSCFSEYIFYFIIYNKNSQTTPPMRRRKIQISRYVKGCC